MQGHRPGARLTDGQAHLVEQVLRDPGPAGHRDADQAGGTHVHRGGREGEPDGRHHAPAPVGSALIAASTVGCSGKTWSSAVIRKILSSGSLSQTRANEPPAEREPLERADQHAEPGRVEEVHPAQVDHDLAGPTVDQLEEPFPQSRRGVDVHLTADLEHRVLAHGAGRQRQLHRSSSSRRLSWASNHPATWPCRVHRRSLPHTHGPGFSIPNTSARVQDVTSTASARRVSRRATT